ncbi:CHAT domain-containing protein [Thelonectria olida]|uniref:CHAT domain-containing protein n=1 Tax=Thelonectria olida TaxID=1576542 RepID=A0A9P8W0K6_9HYPO|nr:CHAT domain-containing protein [Thelonectria olida]
MDDLEYSIQAERDLLDEWPNDHPDRADLLHDLGNRLSLKYNETQALSDLEEAIQIGYEALGALPEDHPSRLARLTLLSSRLQAKYWRTEATADLQEHVQVLRQILPDDADHAKRLRNLQLHLAHLYERTASLDDLGEAIRFGREGAHAMSADDPNRVALLNSLGRHIGEKYSNSGASSELEEAIRVLQVAADAAPKGHPERVEVLISLSHWLGQRFSKTKETAHLEEALLVGRDAVDEIPKDDPNHPRQALRPAFLSNVALHLSSKYSRTGEMEHLDEAILVIREATDTTPKDDSNLRLNNLEYLLIDKYAETGETDDLERLILVIQEAVNTMAKDHPGRAERLNNLAVRLMDKYSRTRASSDLGEAIRAAREAVGLTPENDPNLPGRLSNLGNDLGESFVRTGAVDDLEEAVRIARLALNMTPKNQTSYAEALNNLAGLLFHRHRSTGDSTDLKESIERGQEAVREAPHYHPRRPQYLSGLSASLGYRFEMTGAIADLDDAIRAVQGAVQMNSEPGLKATQLSNLGSLLRSKHATTGQIGDLEESIRIQREVIATMPQGHPDRQGALTNLGGSLNDKYSIMGTVVDLEEAIEVTREAVESTPKDHPDRAGRLSNLAFQLGARYTASGKMSHLDEAIRFAQESVDATPQGHSRRLARLNNLADMIRLRSVRTGEMSGIRESIRIGQEVVDATPKGNSERARVLHSLGGSLIFSFMTLEDADDLEYGVQVARESADLTPKDHAEYGVRLHDLALLLHLRFSTNGMMEDLEEAIMIAKEGLDATPEDHPRRAKSLMNLGHSFNDKHWMTGDPDDLEQAIAYRQSALEHVQAPIMSRILAGREAVKYCADLPDWKRAYEISKLTISLVPKLTMRSLANADKQYRLSEIAGLASNAAAAAANAEMNVLDLRQRHPELADEFVRLQNELETPTAGREDLMGIEMPKPRAQQRYDAGKEFDELVTQVRQQPGFEDFLLAPRESDMREAAKYGPIVILNVSEFRCDAILIEQDKIRLLSLPRLSKAQIEEKAEEGNMGRPSILSWLWDVIARPVLDALGYTGPPTDDKWPRVWWIPTGLLSKFPIHAAGYHDDISSATVLSRVISSYIPSVKAIIHGRQHPSKASANEALLIGMEHTPGQSRLPFAAREMDMLRGLCKSMRLDPVEPRRHKADVLLKLLQCKIFHFAGHGLTDELDPSNSHLLLEDSSDPLTVANLLETNLRRRSPFLAYLSACGTGQIGAEKYTDESIHLISSFQLAGFRHVIGTLWEVNDEICVEMARITYEGIKAGGMTDKSVSQGLHDAATTLRGRWISEQAEARGGRKSDGLEAARASVGRDARDDRDSRRVFVVDDEEPSMPWVPYVHFGA